MKKENKVPIKKISSYRKMKEKYEARIQELTNDVITLVEEKDFIKVFEVKTRWKIQLNMDVVVWGGNTTGYMANTFGFLSKLKPSN
jgi:hypothetical protein